MNPEIESGDAVDAYVSPDVVRLGTAEALTAASAGQDFTGDCTSTIC